MRVSSLLLPLFLLGATLTASAQKRAAGGGAGYQTGIGLRAGGYATGLTVKHFLSGKDNVAAEGLLTTEYQANGARLTVLLEKHVPISDIRGLQFYYGAGAHLGAYRTRYYFQEVRFRRGRNYDYYYTGHDALHPSIGADLVLGLEYKLPDLPFVVGIDYKPFFDIYNGYTGFYSDAALSLRYSF